MKIKSIHIQNFRCIEDLTIDFEQDLTVFVAVNGGGKTTIMDAIAASFCPYLKALNGNTPNQISIKDIRHLPNGSRPEDLTIKIELIDGTSWTMPLSVIDSQDEDKLLNSRAHELSAPLYKNLTQLAGQLAKNGNQDTQLPVIAYYRSTRNLEKAPKPKNTDKEFSRLDILPSALNAVSNYQDVIDWLFAKEGEELRANRDSHDIVELKDLKCVRDAVTAVIKPAEQLYFTSTTPAKPALRWRDNGAPPSVRLISQLSDGYRNALALVMDFARRLAQANPHLENPLETEAIMLVDEIDLHLHPSWQQTILTDLKATFPNTQFIVTTHSPQTLTSVESLNIRILDQGKVHRAPSGSYGAESGRLLERIMGTNRRPPNNPQVKKIEQLMQYVSDQKLAEAQILLKELQDFYQGNEPSLDELEIAIENRQWEATLLE